MLDWLYRRERRGFSLENGNVPLTAPSLVRLMAGEEVAAGITVTPEKAAGLTAVWRAVAILSSTAAALPLEVRRRSDATVVADDLLEGRSQVWTGYELKELVLVHLLLHGNAYLLRSGRHLVPLDPRTVEPKFVMRGNEPVGRVFVVRKDGEEYGVTDEELIHIPGLGFDGLAGQSPIALARQSLGTSLATERHAGRFFGNGTQISGILRSDKRLKEEEAESLKRRWQLKIAGPDNAHGIAVLDNGADFTPVGISPADAQLLEARSFGVEEVARLYGVPVHLLGDSSKNSSWGAGLAEQNAAFVMFSLKPYLARIEARLSVLVPSTQRPVFNTTALTRGTTKERFGAYRLALDSAPWQTINEVRASEGFAPLPDGDVLPLGGARPVEVEELQK